MCYVRNRNVYVFIYVCRCRVQDEYDYHRQSEKKGNDVSCRGSYETTHKITRTACLLCNIRQ